MKAEGAEMCVKGCDLVHQEMTSSKSSPRGGCPPVARVPGEAGDVLEGRGAVHQDGERVCPAPKGLFGHASTGSGQGEAAGVDLVHTKSPRNHIWRPCQEALRCTMQLSC